MFAPDESAEADPPVSAHVDRSVALLSIAGFWLFYFLLNTVRMALTGEAGQFEMIPRRTIVAACGVGLTWLLHLLLRRLDHHSLSGLVTVAFLAALPLSFTYATINFVAFYVVFPSAQDTRERMMSTHGSFGLVADSALTWYFFVVAWAVLYIALSYAVRVRNAERNTARYRAEAQTAQLRALRYQVNPHFLFNTLNSLSTLVLRGRNEEAEQMILNLATFFRSSLADVSEDVPLAEEIRMQRLYLDIEQVRFPDRLKVEIDVSPELDNAAVPAMLLQPLVENAIKHGVARSPDPVTVAIRARADGREFLRIVVEDDALAARNRDEPEKPGRSERRQHVGLRNVRARLKARFGDSSHCHHGPRPGGGFQVAILLPLKRHA